MRISTRLLWLAFALAAGGLLLIQVFPGDPGTFTFGYTSSDDGGRLPLLVFMTARRTVGVALVWVASLLVAGVIGHRQVAKI